MNKIRMVYIGMIVLLSMLLCACTDCELQQETKTNSPVPEPTVSSKVQTAKTDSNESSSGQAEAFGRYAVALNDAIYFIRDKEIVRKAGDKEKTLFSLPLGGAVEDLFVSKSGDLYFSILMEEKNEAYNRTLLKASIKEGSYSLEQISSIKGPILADADMIYYIENDRLMSYDCNTNGKAEIAKVGNNTELYNWGYFDGKTLYYSVYEETENGTLYGTSKLYRFELAEKRTTFIGDCNKPYSSEFILGQNGTLCNLTDNVDHFELHIIDSAQGEINSPYTIPKTILKEVGSEKILFVKDAVYLLIGGVADKTGVSVNYSLSAYKIKAGESEKIWTNDFPQAIACYEIDRINETISVLTEGNDQVDPMLYNLSLNDGKISGQSLVKNMNRTTTKMVRMLKGNDLIYSMIGEDLPRPTLERVIAE